MQWHETTRISEIHLVFSPEEKSDGVIGVKLVFATGQALILNEYSLSSQPLPLRTGFVLSVIHGTVALTRLLSLWMESDIRTIADQPSLLMSFLNFSEMITQTWSQLRDDLIALSGTRAKWRRK